METTRPQTVVLGLVDMINGQTSRLQASRFLDPQVIIHMDHAVHRGIGIWQKWIHLIRNCGKIQNLKMTACTISPDPREADIVNLTARWSGETAFARSATSSSGNIFLRYRIEDHKIVEIWTRKSNYVFIFGRLIKYRLFYRLYLGWAIVYFLMLASRKIDFRLDR